MTSPSSSSPHHRHLLACAIAVALVHALPVAPAHAGPGIIADGSHELAPAGEYSSSDDGAAGHVFHAMNNGSISTLGPVSLQATGANTAAAMAESGAVIIFHGGSVATSGDYSAGVSVGQDARIDLFVDGSGQGVSVSTSGVRGYAARADAGALNLDQASLLTTGIVSDGVLATNGAQVQVTGGSIRTEGSQSNGVSVLDASAVLDATHIETAAFGSDALLAQAGGRIDGENLTLVTHGSGSAGATAHTGGTLRLVDSQVRALADFTTGVRGGGDITLLATDVHVSGAQARAIELNGGTLQMQGGLVQSDHSRGMGVFLWADSRAELTGTRITVGDYGLNINGNRNDVRLTDVDITTHGDIGTGIWAPSASTLQMTGGSISTAGAGGVAIDNRASDVALDGVRVSTLGASAHGVYASLDTSSGRPRYQVDRIDVSTAGAGAIGVVTRLGGEVTMRDSVIRTTGTKGYGVLSGGPGFLQLHGTTVRTEGLGAWAGVVNANGWLDIDGGALESQRHGALWVRSARQVSARNGARLIGGNGTLMAVDAAFAAPFEFSLDQDVYAQGDIVITPEDIDAGIPVVADIRVRLNGRSHWRGATTVANQVSLSDASRWTLTGDSTVGQLDLRDSTLALSTGAARFNTLTVDGDFHTSNSLLIFNGALGGDDAQVDRLHVRGDSSGNADIQVNNVHGLGAQTDNGIQLIQVDGVSGADYRLVGRAVAGRYDYFLHKGGARSAGDGHWYLRSELGTTPPDPCETDPDGPGCAVLPPQPCEQDPQGADCGDPPVLPPNPCEADPDADCGRPRPPQILRPEAGAYLANQAAAIGLFQHRLHDRHGEQRGDIAGGAAWLRASGANQRQDIGGQLAVRGRSSSLFAGVDLLQADDDRLRAGVLLAAGQASHEVASQRSGYTARGTVKGSALGVYASWLQRPQGDGAYLDGWLQHGRYRSSVQGIGLAREQLRARSNAASLEGGYAWVLREHAGRRLLLQPQLQLSWTDYRANTLVEQNGTVVRAGNAGGLETRLGLRLSGEGGVVQPFVALDWRHAGRANQVWFDDQRLQGGVPGNLLTLRGGAQVQLGNRWRAWGDLGLQRGQDHYRGASVQLGMKAGW